MRSSLTMMRRLRSRMVGRTNRQRDSAAQIPTMRLRMLVSRNHAALSESMYPMMIQVMPVIMMSSSAGNSMLI